MYKHIDFGARIRSGVSELADEFRGVFGIETIQRCADEATVSLRDARITEYIPLSSTSSRETGSRRRPRSIR